MSCPYVDWAPTPMPETGPQALQTLFFLEFLLLSDFQGTKALWFLNLSLWSFSRVSVTIFCIELPWQIFDIGASKNQLLISTLPYSCCSVAAVAAGRTCSAAAWLRRTTHARFRVRQLRVVVLLCTKSHIAFMTVENIDIQRALALKRWKNTEKQTVTDTDRRTGRGKGR